jgi:16S rRNA (uracil1498-N3)-methyltransferase
VAHVFVDGPLADELVISGADGHHLARVRRLRTDEEVTAADGAGRWRAYRIAEVARTRLVLVAHDGERQEPTLTPPLAVAFALTKGTKPETVVAHLTELGVDRIVPVHARRSVVRWQGARAQDALARLGRVARESAMQSRRARLPTIEAPATVADLVGEPGLVVAERAGRPAAALPEPGPVGWLVAVGPEGGFDPDEQLVLAGAPRLGVGPHVLRAETAAVAAAAALSGLRVGKDHHAG